MAAQIGRRGHAQATVVGETGADEGGVRQVAHAHAAVEAFGGQIDDAVAQVERDAHIGMQFVKQRHQRRHVAAAEAGRGGDAQLPAGAHAAGADGGFHVGDICQDTRAFFQKGGAFMREGEAARGAHQQFHAQARFQRIQPAADHGRGHSFGLRSGGQAAALCHRDEGFDLLELVHDA